MPITGARVKSRKDQLVHPEDGVTTATGLVDLAEFLLEYLSNLPHRVFVE